MVAFLLTPDLVNEASELPNLSRKKFKSGPIIVGMQAQITPTSPSIPLHSEI